MSKAAAALTRKRLTPCRFSMLTTQAVIIKMKGSKTERYKRKGVFYKVDIGLLLGRTLITVHHTEMNFGHTLNSSIPNNSSWAVLQ